MNYVSVKKRGPIISVITTERFDSISEFAKVADRRYPVYLSFDGKGILHRNTASSAEATGIKDRSAPMTNPDILEQTVPLINGSQIRTYTRKEKIDEVTGQLQEYGFQVFQVILGPFACSAVADTGGEDARIRTENYYLVYSNRVLVSMAMSDALEMESIFTVDSMDVSIGFLVAFSNAICHFTGLFFEPLSYTDFKKTREEFCYKSLNAIVRLPFLAACFIILLGNYLLYKHYRSENLNMRNELAGNSEEIDRYEKLTILMKQKEEYFSSSGYHERSLISFYADRMAAELPEGLKLKRLTFFPETKKSPGSTAVLFQNEIIHISGNAVSGMSIHAWITALKEFRWVAEVKMLGYSDSGHGLADFVIQINLAVN